MGRHYPVSFAVEIPSDNDDDDDDDDAAIFFPYLLLQEEARLVPWQRCWWPCPILLVIDDDPTPRKPSRDPTPSFVAETPLPADHAFDSDASIVRWPKPLFRSIMPSTLMPPLSDVPLLEQLQIHSPWSSRAADLMGHHCPTSFAVEIPSDNDDDDDDAAIFSPLPPLKKRLELDHGSHTGGRGVGGAPPILLVIDDDPTPRKPSQDPMPSFVAETALPANHAFDSNASIVRWPKPLSRPIMPSTPMPPLSSVPLLAPIQRAAPNTRAASYTPF